MEEKVLDYISRKLGGAQIVSHKIDTKSIAAFRENRITISVVLRDPRGKEIKASFNYLKLVREVKKESRC